MGLNNFSIPYSITVLTFISISTMIPIMGWVNAIISNINCIGSLSIKFLGSKYDFNGFYVLDFKVINDNVEFVKLFDVYINGFSFKGFGDSAYFSYFSDLEYNFGIIVYRDYASKFSITVLGKSTIYIRLYITESIVKSSNDLSFTFKFIKGFDNSIQSVVVLVDH